MIRVTVMLMRMVESHADYLDRFGRRRGRDEEACRKHRQAE